MNLSVTLEQVRARELAYPGDMTKRWPVPWWPQGPNDSYCVAWQTVQLGLRRGDETPAYMRVNRQLISISAFRAHYQWSEVHPNALKPGMLVLFNFTGDRETDGQLTNDHMEWIYSTDYSDPDHPTMWTIGANTGPAPGTPVPLGIYKKHRAINGSVTKGIIVPYADPIPSRARRHEVAVVAAFVNQQVKDDMPPTKAANRGDDWGMEGRNYWRRVQTWGMHHGYYPPPFLIDGIPGPRSRIVEAAAYKAATRKK